MGFRANPTGAVMTNRVKLAGTALPKVRQNAGRIQISSNTFSGSTFIFKTADPSMELFTDSSTKTFNNTAKNITKSTFFGS